MSFSSLPNCSDCGKNPSTTSCEGCQKKFCQKCIHEHRDELSRQMDTLCNTRNELVEMMSNPSTNSNSCLQEIDKWRKEMHAQIDHIASKARDYIQKSAQESNKNVRTELDRVSQELQERQKSGGYVEYDLSRIRQQLENINNRIQQLYAGSRIDTSNSKNINWDSLLRISSISESLVNSKPAFTQASPSHHNPPHQMSNSKTPRPHQQFYANNGPTSRPFSAANPSQSFRNTPVDLGYRTRSTFTCIGCKTTNDFNPYGPNICATCRCPAPL